MNNNRGVCYSGFNLAPILYVAFYLPDHKNIIFVGLGPNFKVPTSILRFGSPLLEVKKKFLKFYVYGYQKLRLEKCDSGKKSVLKKTHSSVIYGQKTVQK